MSVTHELLAKVCRSIIVECGNSLSYFKLRDSETNAQASPPFPFEIDLEESVKTGFDLVGLDVGLPVISDDEETECVAKLAGILRLVPEDIHNRHGAYARLVT